MSTPAIEVRNLWRSYERGSETVHALRDFSLSVTPGEMIGLVEGLGRAKRWKITEKPEIDAVSDQQ